MRYYFLLLVVCISCTKGPSTPEGLIEMYISDLMTKDVDKDYFEKYTGGKLWESVADLSEEDFKKFINIKKVKNPKIEISNKSCRDNSCTLTYIIKYDLLGENDKSFKSEVKKIAILKEIEKNWKIFEVTNVKTFVDSKTPIEVMK